MSGVEMPSRPSSPIEPGWLAADDARPAIIEPTRGEVSYRDLDRLADRVAARLRALGLGPEDRVGLWLRRSTDTVAAILGALRAGCAYVPVDPAAPAQRNVEILADCGVRVTLVEEKFAAACEAARASAGLGRNGIEQLAPVGLGRSIGEWARHGGPGDTFPREPRSPRATAVLLYTSGSTGRPKGWAMRRQAIAAHALWCREFLRPSRVDVFANHAQFNFGMSLFDLFASLTNGAALVLVPDEIRLLAPRIVELWSQHRVSIWFSAPAILGLVAGTPELETRDLSALRVVAFAGERFPAPRLEELRRRLPHPRFFNLYGTTETNVAASWELPRDRRFEESPPIGRPCSHYEARVVGADAAVVRPGETGEFQLRGAGLDAGYFDRPELNAACLLAAEDGGPPWYRTGDLVAEGPDGDLRYAGRIGRMVKLRGYRVEPGEIETRLHAHPDIREAAVVPVEGPDGLRLVAHVGGARLPVVRLKLFCAETLPPYMVPAQFVFHEKLPRNLRGKIDLAALRDHVERGPAPAPGPPPAEEPGSNRT